MSDLPPRPAFWPYLPGYALLLLSVLLCASGSYRFVTPMALADGVDLVYLSQGLALLPLGTGLAGPGGLAGVAVLPAAPVRPHFLNWS